MINATRITWGNVTARVVTQMTETEYARWRSAHRPVKQEEKA
jgi:hypothetical protein